jgi:hypothetical protein
MFQNTLKSRRNNDFGQILPNQPISKSRFFDRHLLIFGAAIPKRSQTVLRRCETAVNSIFDRPMPLRSLATPSFDYNRRFTVSRCPVVAPPDSNSPVR